MNVAITDWDGRVSPVFDCASRLLVAEIRDGAVVSRRHERFNPDQSTVLAEQLHRLGIDVLICGAISRTPSLIVEQSGIKLIPFIGGETDAVLEAYARGDRLEPEFLMPGCGRGRQRGNKRACGGKRACTIGNREVSVMPRRDGTGPMGQGPGTGRGLGGCVGGRGRGAGTGQRGQGMGTGRGAGGRGRGNRK
ncbi:MAG: hypothetical protein B5M56_00695 [Desulfococcus sp. 4484_241]|nr:MAG: hypothetical protein B5M56_00695 [Desulfococcus sp. 4484_241]RLC29827.1 MAG: hypothetical protein DRH32_06730 [Deltaproteobacteria bacterium]